MKKNNPDKEKNYWVNKKAIVVFHEATTGLAYDLRDYLLKQGIRELLFISHPLIYLKENLKKSSRYELYRQNKLIKTKTAFHWVLPAPLLYLKDFFYTIFWCMTISRKYDLFFGIDNLNAFSGCFLRLLKRVERVIYYVIDYVPQRFTNKPLNEIYHRIEKFSAQHCDWTWNLSPRMIEARRKKWQRNFPHQLVVWHGVNFERIKKVPFEDINRYEIIYMGTIFKRQGIQLIVETLPLLIKKIPQIRLTIIGKGPYEEELIKLVSKLELNNCVAFLGYIPDHMEIENRIARSAIALALYDPRDDNFVYYTDPGKVKIYLGAGVPVIITDATAIAREIKKAKCGFLVNYNREELLAVLLNFFSNQDLMIKYRANTLEFAKNYDWNYLFSKALDPLTGGSKVK